MTNLLQCNIYIYIYYIGVNLSFYLVFIIIIIITEIKYIVTFSSEIWLNATALRNYRKKKKSQSIFCHCAANQNSLANPASNRLQPLLWIL